MPKEILSKNIIESELAERNMHLFVYGKNDKKRERLLKEIADNHPFVFNSQEKCVVYIDEIGFPFLEQKDSRLDLSKRESIAFEYLNFTIVQAILIKISKAKQENLDAINQVVNAFRYYKDFDSIEEVIKCLQESREFYLSCYNDAENYSLSHLEKLSIQFIFDISMMINDIQTATKNDSSFQIILDRKGKIAIESVNAINSIVNMRCNGALSVKVVCEVDEWETNRDITNSFPEYIHDYDILDLDGSYKKSLNKRMESFKSKFDNMDD